jgi:hypothetical protein
MVRGVRNGTRSVVTSVLVERYQPAPRVVVAKRVSRKREIASR